MESEIYANRNAVANPLEKQIKQGAEPYQMKMNSHLILSDLGPSLEKQLEKEHRKPID